MAGKPLQLKPSIFDGKHGTVLDSGTTYAYLPEAAFLAFKDAVRFLFTDFFLYFWLIEVKLTNVIFSLSV